MVECQKVLPDKTLSSMREILLRVNIKRTIRVMFVKAPFWISKIRLLVRFTDKSLFWVENANGVNRSGKVEKKSSLVGVELLKLQCSFLHPHKANFLDDFRLLATNFLFQVMTRSIKPIIFRVSSSLADESVLKVGNYSSICRKPIGTKKSQVKKGSLEFIVELIHH